MRLRQRREAHADSPLLGPLLDDLSEVFEEYVLNRGRLSTTDFAMLARAGRGCRDAVKSSGNTCAGDTEWSPLTVNHFLGSVEMLAWARENKYRWNENTCARAAYHGNLEVLRWARENGCRWDAQTCAQRR